jgi:chitinase
MYMRANSVEAFEMPPLAHETVDKESMTLLREWIESMPGPPVLAPPVITPVGGNYDNAVDVTIGEQEAGAEIRYTLDGSAPTVSDMLYRDPIHLTDPTVVRARAFKAGFTRSIVAQAVFIVGR